MDLILNPTSVPTFANVSMSSAFLESLIEPSDEFSSSLQDLHSNMQVTVSDAHQSEVLSSVVNDMQDGDQQEVPPGDIEPSGLAPVDDSDSKHSYCARNHQCRDISLNEQ
jgi:hypothetical protein